MLKITDGRPSMYQWDTNRTLTPVDLPNLHHVDFSQSGISPITVFPADGLITVPNIMLQKSHNIVCYIVSVDSSGEMTIAKETFSVKCRPKPADYVYTETEAYTWDQFAEKQNAKLEEVISEARSEFDTIKSNAEKSASSSEESASMAKSAAEAANASSVSAQAAAEATGKDVGKIKEYLMDLDQTVADGIANINAAAESSNERIEQKTDEQLARIPEVLELSENVSLLNSNLAVEQTNRELADSELRAGLSDTKAQAEAAVNKANTAGAQAEAAVNRANAVGERAEMAYSAAVMNRERLETESRKTEALWKLNQGISYQFEQDDTESYQKVVPSGAKLTSIKQLSGMTIVWNQLVRSDAASVTPLSGHTIVSRIDGVWEMRTADGTQIDVTGGVDMVFDISLMFKNIVRPAAVDDFRAMLPNDYYPYNPGEIMSMPVNQVDISKNDGGIISTTLIPSDVQALDGYGDAVSPVANNYVDFESKTYHKKIGRIDLGTIDWQYRGNNVFSIMNNNQLFFVNDSPSICSRYLSSTFPSNAIIKHDKVISTHGSYKTGDLMVRDTDYDDATAFKAAMSGVMLIYRLKNEIVTDISDMIGDVFQKPMNVEAGGGITFRNANGEGFRVPIFNTEEYLIALAEVNG